MVSRLEFLNESRELIQERSLGDLAGTFWSLWKNNEFPQQGRYGPVVVTYLEEMLSVGKGEQVVEFVADQAGVPKNDAAKFIQQLGAETAGDAKRVNKEYGEWRTSENYEEVG